MRMSSKLFHTVVAFGITLGAASVGCSAEAVDAPASSEAAVITTDKTEPTDTKAEGKPATATPPGLPPAGEKDRFCEVAWPTTKGGPRPDFSCIDPTSACGTYPSVDPDLAEIGIGFWNAPTCYEVAADGNCTTKETWMFCKTESTSHEWACPAGLKKSTECTWPAPDNSGTTTTESPNRSGYGYGG
jgi:hypothetical protein